ncbi:hypothetical protein BGV67_12825 [Burkholderia ubonensis]|nr:hypothetical protein WJ77_30475 [Burkholderia ubonensis]KVR55945.1 hypothetical protein WK18_27845 [Burkholderia ubonensis]KVX10174.1 hypothetical protein WL03_01545 [Burkholderia ubonensis]KVX35571.1 hypothetical protein WL04_14950 [Burkholderia ubonensis]KWB42159.1 hypothetical protein WL35_18195 [Burkholderia ubonensis]
MIAAGHAMHSDSPTRVKVRFELKRDHMTMKIHITATMYMFDDKFEIHYANMRGESTRKSL